MFTSYLKHSFLLATAILFLSPNSFATGVVSGGGGGDTNSGLPATFADIREVAVYSRGLLYAHFKALQARDPQRDEILSPLFEAHQTIFDVLERTSVYVSPVDCKSIDGKSVDGSIYSPFKNTICISAGRLSQKLKKENVMAQILSLIAHEYSHLLGYDEGQANRLQNLVLTTVRRLSFTDLQKIQGVLNVPLFTLERYSKEVKNWNYLCFISNELYLGLDAILTIHNRSRGPYDNRERASSEVLVQALNADEIVELVNYLALTNNVRQRSCGESDFYPEANLFKNEYRDLFKGQKTVKASQIEKGASDAFILKKIDSVSEANAEMNAMLAYSKKLDKKAMLLWSLSK